ncbi:VOC family protein [Longispora albida]|uniref:VOC family protein n=1 Tax=Longispora albida TaxID=203523 RepID=UPI0003A3BCFA|nr:VOC family protein [Longispora albida]
MTENKAVHVWPGLSYRDAPAAIRFLTEAFGFVSTLTVPGDVEGAVVHAELRWPEGGGVMLGTAGAGALKEHLAGQGSVYIVTSEPDALYERAVAAGGVVVRELGDTDYGSRDFIVRDPEGVYWCFGTYAGE